LIVEDDEASRILAKDVLECLNVTIIETGYAEEALSLFKKHNSEFALVLLDLTLPRWDGCELLKQFREINPLIPAIAVSALRPFELNAKCRVAGFDNWMSKPIDIDLFLEIVKAYV
jgi:CheY-like chemotaxis protein